MNALWYCVRQDGAAKRCGWTNDVALDDLPQRVGAGRGDMVEVSVASGFRPIAPARHGRAFRRRKRGIVGMEIAYREDVARLAPTSMIAANLGFNRAIEKYLREKNAALDDLAANGGLRLFSARQFLLPGAGGRGAHRTVPRLDPRRTDSGGQGRTGLPIWPKRIGRWMLRNLSADGGLPYKYWAEPRSRIAGRQRHSPLPGVTVPGTARGTPRRRGDSRRGPCATCGST